MAGVSLDLSIEGHPERAFDVHMPTTTPRQVVIFLHGGGGDKEGVTLQLGLDALSQEQLDASGIAWVLPQGANANPPETRTWSNYVMNSGYVGPNGEDDVAFLVAIAQWARSTLGAERIVLGGHSNGGMMTHRIWCEADELFDRFMSVAGPPSVVFDPSGDSPLPCSGSKPYWAIIGNEDGVIQTEDLNAETWTILRRLQSEAFVNPVLMNEIRAHDELRMPLVCPDDAPVAPTDEGQRRIRTACDQQLLLWLILRPADGGRLNFLGQHPIAVLEEDGQFTLRDLLSGWE